MVRRERSAILLGVIGFIQALEGTQAYYSCFPLTAHLRRSSSVLCPSQKHGLAVPRKPQTTAIKLEMASKFTPPTCNIKGVLFDIDGTLFDSDPVHFEVFQELLAKEGINDGEPINEEFFRTKIAGRQNARICADLFPQWDTATAEAWSAAKEAAFRAKAVGKLVPMPGLDKVMALIDKLGLKKAAVTNAPRPNAEFMLGVMGRLEWFDTIVIGDECLRAKPDPLPYQVAMDRLGLEPSACVVIEDSPSGAAAGVASGAWTVGILTSQEAEVLETVGCKLLIEDYTDARFLQVLELHGQAAAQV